MAETTLRKILGSQDRRAWNMLFDLYRVQNREKEFDQLALDYAMQFETSPPVWQKIGGAAKSAPPSQAKAEASSLELPGLLDKAAADRLGDELAAAAANSRRESIFRASRWSMKPVRPNAPGYSKPPAKPSAGCR
jgi:hypothetical protein